MRRALVMAALSLTLVWSVCNNGASAQSAPADSQTSMTECTGKILDRLKLKDPPSLEDIKRSTEICYSLLREQGLLKDFSVRALNYEQQYRSNGILLWMVVVITISGVILAGLQLLASYRLAVASGSNVGADSQLTLARDQIALKSSVTGLAVMLLSFAFFLVFVRYVYKIEDIGDPNQPVANLGSGIIDSIAPTALPAAKVTPPTAVQK